ncbi:SMP-30/gluconolactonase/LRE family protein [Skermanella stibiiresistens]|uniref:SMP-30/gluconolactonase/LRE family protein n=1 Tax=Skermanella stibiiresistens TaxID=913326 RepID=UPI0004B42EE8|nr:SMP-30/gluconolactonase/LRE family protein [Skermanella stibiiresistens]
MPDSNQPDVGCVLDARATIGECPVWSAEEQALYWVDILAPTLNRLDPVTGATRTWEMPASIGSFGLREAGGAVVALRTGFHLFDFDSGALTLLANPEPDQPGNRLNDGKVSPDGSFWAGTMDEEGMSRPLGSLYRLAPDGSCARMVEGLIVSNGLAWSADGATLFLSDSRGKKIMAFDHDPATGALSNRRVIAEPTEEIGRPDGAATDREGFYWSAGVSAAVLNRWSPDGRLDRQIPMPCAAPTMPCFGGPDMRTIYVTSLRHNVLDEKLAAYPLSGGIFAVEVDVPGVPVPKFRG